LKDADLAHLSMFTEDLEARRDPSLIECEIEPGKGGNRLSPRKRGTNIGASLTSELLSVALKPQPVKSRKGERRNKEEKEIKDSRTDLRFLDREQSRLLEGKPAPATSSVVVEKKRGGRLRKFRKVKGG